MMSIIDYALLAGYSISWDGDVSEKGFSAKKWHSSIGHGYQSRRPFTVPGEEVKVTQENRQAILKITVLQTII